MECRTQTLTTVIPNDPNIIRATCNCFIQDVDGFGYDAESAVALVTGFAEAMANAHAHGNRREPQRTIAIHYALSRHQACLDICDQGDGFDPASVPDPTDDENIGKPSGRGLWLMRAMFDSVEFMEGGRRVRLTRRTTTAPPIAARQRDRGDPEQHHQHLSAERHQSAAPLAPPCVCVSSHSVMPATRS